MRLEGEGYGKANGVSDLENRDVYNGGSYIE